MIEESKIVDATYKAIVQIELVNDELAGRVGEFDAQLAQTVLVDVRRAVKTLEHAAGMLLRNSQLKQAELAAAR